MFDTIILSYCLCVQGFFFYFNTSFFKNIFENTLIREDKTTFPPLQHIHTYTYTYIYIYILKIYIIKEIEGNRVESYH